MVIPEKVFSELSKVPKPIPIIERISWLEVRSESSSEMLEQLEKQLDPGEAQAIALAI